MDFNNMFKNIKESFLYPSKTAKKLVGKVSFSDGIVTILLVGIIASLITVILSEIIMLMGGNVEVLPAFLGWIIARYTILIMIPLSIVISVVFTTIDFGVVWFIGKLLGGKAKFGEFYGPLVYSTAAVSLLSAVIAPFMYIWGGISICLFDIIQLILTIKNLANQVIFTKEAHQISTWRAVSAVLCPLILAFVVGFVVAVIVLLHIVSVPNIGQQANLCPSGAKNCYENDYYGFSVTYPEGWKPTDIGWPKIAFGGPKEGNLTTNCNIEEGPLPTSQTFASYIDSQKAAEREYLQDYNYTLVSENNMTISGQQGYKLVSTFNREGYAVEMEQVIFIKNGIDYAITCLSTQGTSSKYEPDFDTIITSFKFAG